jgi:A/G-specific adenine glycosylase
MPTPGSRWFARTLLAWGRENRRDFPWRKETDPFRILVAELLLQRSRSKTVATVYGKLFARWPDAKSLASASVRSIESVTRPLGLVRRASTVKAIAKAIAQRGHTPQAVSELKELPGVGEYVAHATAAAAFGAPVATVDGVTARVYRRFFEMPATQPPVADRQLWALVADITPRRAVREWNWAVLDLAAGVCLPKIPKCSECPLRSRCAWAIKNS